MGAIYGAAAGDCSGRRPTSAGWVGHSTSYTPAARRLHSVLDEGTPVGTPDAGGVLAVIAQQQCQGACTSPTAFPRHQRDEPTAL